MSQPETESPRAFAQVWASSAAAGFLLGLGHATWQVSVESAQALAGIVHYPPTNPFYLYHLKLWTLVNQLSALLLWLGLSEVAVSCVVSGLLGMVSISALALVVYALTRERAIALIAPFFIHMTPAPHYGVSYPIWLLGSPHTYGILGLAFDLLVLAVLGCGRYRPGLLLLGLAPAIHPSLGAWLWLVTAAVAVADAGLRRAFVAHWRWLAAGAVVLVSSFAAQRPFVAQVPKPTEDVTRYFVTYVRDWDAHRRAVDFSNDGIWIGLAVAGLALLWLGPFRRETPDPARVLLKAFAVLGLAAAPLLALSFVDPARIPATLLVLMPNRLINVNVLASMAVLLALLWRRRGSPWGLIGVGVLVVGLVFAFRSRYLTFLREVLGLAAWQWSRDRLETLVVAAALLLVAAVLARRGRATDESAGTRALRNGLWIALGTAPVLAFALVPREWERSELRERRRDRVYAELAQGEGLVAVASDEYLVQLRTRRPLILEPGGLDMLPYVTEAAPEMTRLLRLVYGIDLFALPAAARGTSSIPAEHNRAVWEARSLADWQVLRRELGIRDVLARRDWTLNLPAGGGNRDLRLYHIPE